MPSASIEFEWLTIQQFGADEQNGGDAFFVVADIGPLGKVVGLLQALIPGTIPALIDVSNVRVEGDLYDSASGDAQIRKASGGFYKTKSTWNHLDKDEPRTWKEGAFSSADYGSDVYWSGALTEDDPQTHTCSSALAAYIEAAAASAGRFVGLCFISFDYNNAYKSMSGARLKFDWVAAGTPAVTSFTPTSMDEGATPTITITGLNFVGTLTSVQLVGASTYALSGASIVNETTISGTVPAGVAAGSYIVRVNISGQAAADSAQSFAVNSVTATITTVNGLTGTGFVRNAYKQKLTLIGTTLTGASAISIIGQAGQGTHALTDIAVVGATEINGLLPDPPVPPGKYRAQAAVTAGTVQSPEFDVSLGPAFW